jgi:hypothetical protein
VNHYCTLFDANYLARAIVMYRSLMSSGESFQLHAVCFDELSRRILERLGWPYLDAIPLQHVETPRLLAVKADRSLQEYCWTTTPFVIGHVLDACGGDRVTYLDADLRFYSSPSTLLDELDAAGGSILITPHRYAARRDLSARFGKYCVQFTTFGGDPSARSALEWWQDRCLEWCFARAEDGKYGDQKYLDDWPTRFKGVHVLGHIGGGVAPWNVGRYRLSKEDGRLRVDGQPLVFYHFHAYKHYANGVHDLGGFKLGAEVVELLYRPYAEELRSAHASIESVTEGVAIGPDVPEVSWKSAGRSVKRALHGVRNRRRDL